MGVLILFPFTSGKLLKTKAGRGSRLPGLSLPAPVVLQLQDWVDLLGLRLNFSIFLLTANSDWHTEGHRLDPAWPGSPHSAFPWLCPGARLARHSWTQSAHLTWLSGPHTGSHPPNWSLTVGCNLWPLGLPCFLCGHYLWKANRIIAKLNSFPNGSLCVEFVCISICH